MRQPVGQTLAFAAKWEALQRQLETVLSIAHRREPNATETAEAVSIAQYHMQGIAELMTGNDAKKAAALRVAAPALLGELADIVDAHKQGHLGEAHFKNAEALIRYAQGEE